MGNDTTDPAATADPAATKARVNQALLLEVEREHASVRDTVAELRDEIDRLRAEPGPAHRAGRLGGMLTMFRHHLARHFSLEEQGFFLRGERQRPPSATRAIEALVLDHRRFERRLGLLLDAAQRCEAGAAGLTDEFAESLAGFLDELERHEQVENQLARELA